MVWLLDVELYFTICFGSICFVGLIVAVVTGFVVLSIVSGFVSLGDCGCGCLVAGMCTFVSFVVWGFAAGGCWVLRFIWLFG